MAKLRVVTAFGNYRVGDEIERGDADAKLMASRRWYGLPLFELIEEPSSPPAPELIPAVTDQPSRKRRERERVP
jgi:hypothetical protein